MTILRVLPSDQELLQLEKLILLFMYLFLRFSGKILNNFWPWIVLVGSAIIDKWPHHDIERQPQEYVGNTFIHGWELYEDTFSRA